MDKQVNTYTVYCKEIAENLILRGFKLIDTSVNVKFPKFNVFIFENNKEFICAFIEEQIKHKNRKSKLVDNQNLS